MTSVPPRWLMGRARDQDLSDPATVRVVLSLAAVGVVVGLMVWAFRRRDRAFTALAATSLVGITAATFSAARITEPAARQFLAAESMLLYRLYWWPVGAVFVLAITWGNTRIVSAVVRGRVEVVQRWRPAMVPALAVLVAAVGLVMVVSYKGSNDLLEPYYKQQEPNAEAIAELPGSPGEVVIRFAPESDPLEAAAPRERLDEPQDGPHGRYSRAANLLAQLRLRGIAVRFADEADDGYLYLRPYRNEHPAEGDEPVEVLLLAGPGAQDPPPDGYRRISASGEASAGSLLTPTGVYVLSSP